MTINLGSQYIFFFFLVSGYAYTHIYTHTHTHAHTHSTHTHIHTHTNTYTQTQIHTNSLHLPVNHDANSGAQSVGFLHVVCGEYSASVLAFKTAADYIPEIISAKKLVTERTILTQTDSFRMASAPLLLV